MTWECAIKNIDYFFSISEETNKSITFMGGEPFLAFTLIKKIVDYIKVTYPCEWVDYTIVTNGTLVHNEIQDWIKQHESNVQVVLSLDDLGESHNANRSNSFKRIDLDFFRSLSKPIINTVFTPQTIDNLANTIIDLHEYNFYIKGFIADGERWKDKHVYLLGEQLQLLIDYYQKHPQVPPFSLLSMPLYYLTMDKAISRCGTEKNEEVSVSTDGKLWACHRCTPFENHGTWKIPDKYINLINASHLLPECNDCFLEKICNACPASNAAMKDDPELSNVTCSIRKLLFKANAYFATTMLLSENNYIALQHLSNEKKKNLAASAKIILENL